MTSSEKENGKRANTIADLSLPSKNQLGRNDFTSKSLPTDFVKGHLIAKGNYSFDTKRQEKMDRFTICVVQHNELNEIEGHWSRLEDLVRT